MGLKSLFRREMGWWFSSLGLWWAIPLCLLIIEGFPVKVVWFYGVDFKFLEEQWSQVTGLFGSTFNKPFSLDDPMSLLGPMMQLTEEGRSLDQILSLDPTAIWKQNICPLLQMWGMLLLPLFVAPLAIGSFNRDRESGLYLMNRIMGGSSFLFLVVKQTVMAIHLLWMHAIPYFLILLYFQHATPHPELFRLSDPLWILSWFGSAMAVTLLAVSVSWATCFVTRNNQSEFYNAMLVISLFSVFSLGMMSRCQWGLVPALAVTAGALVLTLAMDLLLASWMKRERFVIH